MRDNRLVLFLLIFLLLLLGVGVVYWGITLDREEPVDTTDDVDTAENLASCREACGPNIGGCGKNMWGTQLSCVNNICVNPGCAASANDANCACKGGVCGQLCGPSNSNFLCSGSDALGNPLGCLLYSNPTDSSHNCEFRCMPNVPGTNSKAAPMNICSNSSTNDWWQSTIISSYDQLMSEYCNPAPEMPVCGDLCTTSEDCPSGTVCNNAGLNDNTLTSRVRQGTCVLSVCYDDPTLCDSTMCVVTNAPIITPQDTSTGGSLPRTALGDDKTDWVLIGMGLAGFGLVFSLIISNFSKILKVFVAFEIIVKGAKDRLTSGGFAYLTSPFSDKAQEVIDSKKQAKIRSNFENKINKQNGKK